MADLMNPGGGLTKSKLLLANANPSDVSQGKSFYSNGNKELQTGTLVERGTSQNAGGIGSGGSGSSAYIALNRIPEGIYRSNGQDWAPEIRVNRNDICDYLEFAPCLVVGGSGARVDANVDNNYINGVSTGNWGGSVVDRTFTVKKAGRYAFMASRHVGSGSSSMSVTVAGTSHNARFSFVQRLNAGASIRYYFSASATDWAVWGFCIVYLG